MEYRSLGRDHDGTDIEVSVIGLGSWLTFGTAVDPERSRACIDRAFDLGINFFDTSNIYGRGRAETFLGEALAGHARDTYVLATKAFFPMSEHDRGLSAAQIAKQSDASLRRLGVDHVDLYQCHRYDDETTLEETMAALTRLVESGKARAIGFSEWSPAQITAAAALVGVQAFSTSQPQYSMLWRRPEPEVFPLCAAHGIAQIAFSPLCQGVLTGKYKSHDVPPAGSRGADAGINQFMDRWLTDKVLVAVERLQPLAERIGATMSQMALAWSLRRPEVATALVGVTNPDQLTENAAAAGRRLDDETLEAIDDSLGSAAVR